MKTNSFIVVGYSCNVSRMGGSVFVCEAALQSLSALPIAIASAAVFTASDLAYFKNTTVAFESKVARAQNRFYTLGLKRPGEKTLG